MFSNLGALLPLVRHHRFSPAETTDERAAASNGRKSRRGLKVFTLGGVVAVVAALTPVPAQANAFAYDVYAPKKAGSSQAQGWARLSLDCSETYGCHNYIKIEKRNWWGPSYVGGRWASNNGWDSVTVTLPTGCGEYRTWVDSYNDSRVSSGAGVDIKLIGVNAQGEEIHRFKQTWNSGWTQICR